MADTSLHPDVRIGSFRSLSGSWIFLFYDFALFLLCYRWVIVLHFYLIAIEEKSRRDRIQYNASASYLNAILDILHSSLPKKNCKRNVLGRPS